MRKSAVVSIPASSGNLGPGFDVLGAALTLRNEIKVRVLSRRPGPPSIRVRGEGERSLPRGPKNLVYKAFRIPFRAAGKRVPKVAIDCINRIPLSRGLGSSAAAALGGILAADRILDNPFGSEDVMSFASRLEGHPDNVAPALLGGVQGSGWVDGKIKAVSWPVPRVRAVVAVPDFKLSTKKARAALPSKIPLKDAVRNLSSVVLLERSFQKDLALMRHLLDDKWHEPYRARLIPGFRRVRDAALRAGAFGVVLSGAGPTILSLVRSARASRVASAMKKAFRSRGVRCRTFNLKIDVKGAVCR